MKRLLIISAAVAVVAAACGDTTSTEVTATPPADDAAATTAAPVDTSPGDATLADYLPMYGGPDDETDWREVEMRAQEATARCMAEQGFEYVPYSPSFEDDFVDWEATEAERRAEQGFGMAYWVLYEEEASAQYEEEWNPEDDPNWAITESMSDSEREAYEYALYGEMMEEPPFDWESATEEEIAEFEREMERMWQEREWQGCMELGWEEASGGGDDVWMSFEEEFGDWWEEVDQRVQADPRFIALQQEWVTCMADAGFEFTDQDDMWMKLDEEFNRIVDWPGEDPSAVVATIAPGVFPEELEFVENEDGTVHWVDSEGNVYTEDDMAAAWKPTYDETELRAFMDYEISVAVAEWGCSEGFWDTQGEIYEEYQNQWVAENKDALDAWKAARDAEG